MRRLRMGMIGGGPGSFIGPVHRIAAELDREIELVAGVFSSDAARSRAGGRGLPDRSGAGLSLARCDVRGAKQARDDGIDFVSVVSPNHHHLPAARAALAAGIPVMSDKPLTATLAEARELAGHGRARRAAVRADLHLFGLSAGARGARADCRRGDRRRCARWWSNIRKAGSRARRWASRPNGGSIRPSRGRAGASAISASMRSSSPNSSPG